MSAPITEPIASAPAPAAPAAPATGETDWQAEAEKWKALSRKHEDQSKANADKAKLYDDAQEAAKTQAQKDADEIARLKGETLAAKREAFAAAKGVPSSMVSGSTPEEWEASAAAALAWKGDQPKPPAAPTATGQGKVGEPVGGAKARQVTEAELNLMNTDQINQARREGRLNDLLGIKTT